MFMKSTLFEGKNALILIIGIHIMYKNAASDQWFMHVSYFYKQEYCLNFSEITSHKKFKSCVVKPKI